MSISNNSITDGNGTILLDTSFEATTAGKDAFIPTVGHRWAKVGELSLANEASTAGSINKWTSTSSTPNLPSQ